jgi:hypothetical protein
MSAAFQHIVTLLSFVLAVSVSHLLLTVVEIVRAGPRVRMSFVHALWMANGFLAVIGWWFGIWEVHAVDEWPVLSVLLNLAGVVCVFLAIAFVCPRIPDGGTVNLWEFHILHRRKYATFALGGNLIGIGQSLFARVVQNGSGQNLLIGILALATLAPLAAITFSSPTVQRLAAIATVTGMVLYIIVGAPVMRSS